MVELEQPLEHHAKLCLPLRATRGPNPTLTCCLSGIIQSTYVPSSVGSEKMRITFKRVRSIYVPGKRESNGSMGAALTPARN